MAATSTSKIITIIRGVFAGEIVDNNLNEHLLAAAKTGYRIQSQVLKIPTRFGFFSPGPPRLQVNEAYACAVLLFGIGFTTVYSCFIVLWIKIRGIPNASRMAAVLAVIQTMVIILHWVLACTSKRRAPGFVWEDWKERAD
ncbi:hypothetical protein B0J11DRAFT_146211 [Dendryphion nanum]|uniref:Uncharacterized protein n=1 Tax=Dendryphion nanum TaxID=256645 RepID=A0A9P9D623_9PLEO|nr:hypothetical protein B0J11DRAFT_146211 [Dendryphion nanum]